MVIISVFSTTKIFAEQNSFIPKVTVSLVSDVDSIHSKDSDLLLGIHFVLQEGWKIFWRTPGTAGIPPRFSWKGTENATIEKILWPYPHHFKVYDINTVVYKNEVLFPVVVKIHDPSKKVRIALSINYLLCSLESCIPKEKKLNLDLFPGLGEETPENKIIDKFIKMVPRVDAHDDLTIHKIEMSEDAGGIPVFSITTSSRTGFNQPSLFIEGPQTVFFTAPVVNIKNDGTMGHFTLKAYHDEKKTKKPAVALHGAPVKLTLVNNNNALEVTKIIKRKIFTSKNITLFYFIMIAFLGGVILNFMPCVLPILFIKLKDVINDAKKGTSEIRFDFIITALGILSSFLVLAFIAIALKWSGSHFMWGIQFQQPTFIIIMAIILTIFACNFFGFFEITLFTEICDRLTHHAKRTCAIGHFCKGAFATLLATPCSAPFVGTALSFVLLRNSALEIILIFLSMGVGFAFLYFVIALFPSLAQHIPKPGKWMNIVKQTLGWALVLTTAWLLFILFAQISTLVFIAILISLLVIVLALSVGYYHPKIPRSFIWSIVALIISAGLIIHNCAPSTYKKPFVQTLQKPWQQLDLKAIPKFVNEGKIVFVDITARWCLTCYFNKQVVLENQSFIKILKQENVIAMRGDWSNYSENISNYLRTLDRFAIPLNVIYSKKFPKGILLPEILTLGTVLEAMKKAGYVEP